MVAIFTQTKWLGQRKDEIRRQKQVCLCQWCYDRPNREAQLEWALGPGELGPFYKV